MGIMVYSLSMQDLYHQPSPMVQGLQNPSLGFELGTGSRSPNEVHVSTSPPFPGPSQDPQIIGFGVLGLGLRVWVLGFGV